MAIETPLRPLPSTRWTDLLADARSGDTQRRRDLTRIIECYRGPLEQFLRHELRLTADEAEEMVQGFIADSVVERELLGLADRGQGRLRDYLRMCLRNYCRSRLNRRKAVSARDPHLLDQAARAAEGVPDSGFLRDWATQTIREMVRQMESVCRESGRPDVWNVFHERVARPYLTGERPKSYVELVRALNVTGPTEAHNLLVTGKRLAQRILRGIVRSQVTSDEDIDEEIQFLKRVLSGH